MDRVLRLTSTEIPDYAVNFKDKRLAAALAPLSFQRHPIVGLNASRVARQRVCLSVLFVRNCAVRARSDATGDPIPFDFVTNNHNNRQYDDGRHHHNSDHELVTSSLETLRTRRNAERRRENCDEQCTQEEIVGRTGLSFGQHNLANIIVKMQYMPISRQTFRYPD